MFFPDLKFCDFSLSFSLCGQWITTVLGKIMWFEWLWRFVLNQRSTFYWYLCPSPFSYVFIHSLLLYSASFKILEDLTLLAFLEYFAYFSSFPKEVFHCNISIYLCILATSLRSLTKCLFQATSKVMSLLCWLPFLYGKDCRIRRRHQLTLYPHSWSRVWIGNPARLYNMMAFP